MLWVFFTQKIIYDNAANDQSTYNGNDHGSKLPLRIDIVHRIAADIAVGVDPACKADGIGLQVAAGGGVVVAEVVVVKTRLRLQPLAGEAVIVRGRADKAVLLPEGLRCAGADARQSVGALPSFSATSVSSGVS